MHAVVRQQVSLEYLQQLHELHEQWLVEGNFDDVSQMPAVRPPLSLSALPVSTPCQQSLSAQVDFSISSCISCN